MKGPGLNDPALSISGEGRRDGKEKRGFLGFFNVF